MLNLRPGETVTLPIKQEGPESGAHGALTFGANLNLNGTIVAKTPGDNLLREEATPVSPPATGVVQSNPTFSAGGGAGGKDVYTVVLNTGEGASFLAGDYVRSQAANRKALYLVDSVSTDTLKLRAGTGEMDVQNGDTIEKATGSRWYSGSITVQHSELSGVGHVEFTVIGATSTSRANKPACSVAISSRKIEYLRPTADATDIQTV